MSHHNSATPHVQQLYPEHLSLDDLFHSSSFPSSSSLKQSNYLIGKLIVPPKNMTHSYVENKLLSHRDIVITNLYDRNRAHCFDEVVVELYPTTEWIPFSKMKQKQQAEEEKEEESPQSHQEEDDLHSDVKILKELWEPNEQLLENYRNPVLDENEKQQQELIDEIIQQSDQLHLQPRGKVVAILPSKSLQSRILTGTISLEVPEEVHPNHNTDNKSSAHHGHHKKSHSNHQGEPSKEEPVLLFHPDDPRYLPMIVPSRFPFEPSASYKAAIGDWPVTSKYPHCKDLQRNESHGSLEAELDDLLKNYTVHTEEYSLSILAPLLEKLKIILPANSSDSTLAEDITQATWTIPEEEFSTRLDLRHLRAFTIDPPFSKDLDQAMHITPIYANTSSPSSSSSSFLQSSYDPQDTPIEFEIGVHIADVTYFVPEGSPLDQEARQRGNTVYLIQKSFPMLPRIFSEKFCSLQANEDRLAISVIYRLLPNGQISKDFKPWFGRTIVRSCCKLDYDTAQRMIENVIPSHLDHLTKQEINAIGNTGQEISEKMNRKIEEISEEFWEIARRPIVNSSSPPSGYRYTNHSCWDVSCDVFYQSFLAQQRRSIRLSHGALTLSRSNLSFQFPPPATAIPSTATVPYGQPTVPIGVSLQAEQTEANNLIEEYMLLTNYLVAEKLIETVSSWSFLRRHDSPPSHRLHQLTVDVQTLLKQLNPHNSLFEMKPFTTLHELLAQVIAATSTAAATVADGGGGERKMKDLQILSHSLSSLLLKPIPTAEYFVMMSESSESWKHYALSIPYYTHFTSPIRRYPDITVHRLLLEGLRLEDEKLRQQEEQQERDVRATLDSLSIHVPPPSAPLVSVPSMGLPTPPPHRSHNNKTSSLSSYLTPAKLTQLMDIAVHCNETKTNSKTIQRKCEEIYFFYYLSCCQPLLLSPCEAIITSVGEKFLTLLVSDYLFDHRVVYEEMTATENRVISWNKNEQILRITKAAVTGAAGGGGKGSQKKKRDGKRGGSDDEVSEEEEEKGRRGGGGGGGGGGGKHQRRRSRRHDEDDIIGEEEEDKGSRRRHHGGHEQHGNEMELRLGSRVLVNVTAEIAPKLIMKVEFLNLIGS